MVIKKKKAYLAVDNVDMFRAGPTVEANLSTSPTDNNRLQKLPIKISDK